MPSWDPLKRPYALPGSWVRVTTALVWPRRVMAVMAVADVRGSMRVIWRADVPAARRLRAGRQVRERRAWDVERTSTCVVVGRSQVRRVWSQEVE